MTRARAAAPLAIALMLTMTAACSSARTGTAVPVAAPASGAASSSPTSSSPTSSSPASSGADSSTAEPSAAPSPTAGSSGAPSVLLPEVGLAGVDVGGCRSNSRPVVLLHGSFSTVASNFSAMVPALLASGRCLYGLDYGNGGIGPVTVSAGQFAALVTTVRRVTGKPEVDVIAYSQGGLVLRTALRLDGLANDVATAVLISPSWNGTSSPLAASAPASMCPACADQVAGSALLRRLDVGGDLDGNVRYAEISTRADTVVTPVSSQVPGGPTDRVRSLLVEARCPNLRIDHVRMPAVPGVIAWTVAALDSDGRPSPSAFTC